MFHRPTRIYVYNQARSTALSTILAVSFFIITDVIILVLAVVSFLPGPTQSKPLGIIKSFSSVELASLALNVYVTINTDIVGSMHAAVLRWSLLETRRLGYCSNLRLFTAVESKTSISNSVAFNAVMAVLLILSYTSSSLCFLGTLSGRGDTGNSTVTMDPKSRTEGLMFGDFGGAEVQGTPTVILGLTLLAQSVIASWGYFESNIPTWSPNPVDVASAAASRMERELKRRPDRCLRTAAEANDEEGKESDGPIEPRAFQPSLWHTRGGEVRKVLCAIWALPIAFMIFFGVVSGLTIRGISGTVPGKNWWLLPASSWDDMDVRSPCLSIPWTSRKTNGEKVDPVSWLWAVTLIAVLQAALTLTLHGCELIVQSYRDEATWRKAATNKGLSEHSAIVSFICSPPSLFLVASKCALHWVFGLCIGAYANVGVIIRPAQLLWLTGFLLIIAAVVTLLVFKRWQGPQPSTYGHLQALLDAVDVYGTETMWWGHKYTSKDSGICHAGTDTHKLGELSDKCLYQ